MLKGAGLVDILPQAWPIALFIVVVAIIGLKRYKQTLD
jgi:ABC-2 type transport system permease protein